MRTLQQIEDLIAHRESDLRALHAERRQAKKDRNDGVIAEFVAGRSIGDIADHCGLTYSATQGILFRVGLTEKTRTAIGHRAAEQVAA